MKKQLLLIAGLAVVLTGCSGRFTPEQEKKYVEKALNGDFKKEAEAERTAEGLSDYNPEKVDLVSGGGEKVEWSLRQVLQPGKVWKGYSEIGGGITMPVGVEFTTDGGMQWYAEGPDGQMVPGQRIEIEKIAYNGWSDENTNYDGSGEQIEIEGHDKDLDRIEKKSGVEQEIKKVISFGDALDKGFVLSPAAPIDWLPCGEAGVCKISVDIDGSLLIQLGPLKYNFPN